jgi:hypothetical protein
MPDPNNPGKRTFQYSWLRGTKVSGRFHDFHLMGASSFYMAIHSVTIGDYPLNRPFDAKGHAVHNCFHVKSNWTRDDVLQTFSITRGPMKQQIHGVNFPHEGCLHLVTNPQQDLVLEIIPVFPARADGLDPFEPQQENVPYIFPVKFVNYSNIRLSIVVHLYKA